MKKAGKSDQNVRVKQFVREKDVLIYAIGISILPPETARRVDPELRAAQDVLINLTGLTGGEAFFAFRDVEDICRKLAMELKSQYVLTYRSTNTVRDGKWRNIKAAVDGHGRKLTVRAKKGYTAPL